MVDKNDMMRRNRVVGRLAVCAVLLVAASGCAPYAGSGGGGGGAYGDPGLDDAPDLNPGGAVRYVKSLDGTWLPPVRVPLSCTGCTNKISIDVYLHEGSYDLDPDLIVNQGRKGQIVAMLENPTAVEYPEYGLKGYHRAYLWVGKTKAGRAFAIYEINRSSGKVTPLRLALGAVKCTDMPYGAEPVHEVDKDCSAGHTTVIYPRKAAVTPRSVLQLVTNPLGSPSRNLLARSGDLWFSCSSGCCQANSWSAYPQ